MVIINNIQFKCEANQRILRQRQTLSGVPVTEAQLMYNEREYTVWMYGRERLIHCAEYHKCHCCFVL